MRNLLVMLLLLNMIEVPFAYASVEEQAAEEFCACVNPIIEKVKSMQSALQGGDTSGMNAMMAELQTMQPKLQQCSQALKTKYKDRENDETFKSAVSAEIQKLCPVPKLGPAR